MQFSPQGLYTLTQIESGGNPTARNPRSTATGLHQFLRDTWLAFARANPHLFQGMDQDQILARRTDPAISQQATQWYARQNAAALRQAGIPVNDATLALAHTFGPNGARALFTANSNVPVEEILGQRVIQANPHLAGRTAGDIRDMFNARYGQPLQIAQAPRPPEVSMDFSQFVNPQVIAQFLAGGAQPRPVDPAGGADEAGLAARYGYTMQSPSTQQPTNRNMIAQALMGGLRAFQGPPPMPVPQMPNFQSSGRQVGGAPVAGLMDALAAIRQRSLNRFGGF